MTDVFMRFNSRRAMKKLAHLAIRDAEGFPQCYYIWRGGHAYKVKHGDVDAARLITGVSRAKDQSTEWRASWRMV